MKGIKRSVRTRGRLLGHQLGDQLLAYREAREPFADLSDAFAMFTVIHESGRSC